MKLTSLLFKSARRAKDIEVLLSGSPIKIARRGKNKLIGRRIGKLWKFPF